MKLSILICFFFFLVVMAVAKKCDIKNGEKNNKDCQAGEHCIKGVGDAYNCVEVLGGAAFNNVQQPEKLGGSAFNNVKEPEKLGGSVFNNVKEPEKLGGTAFNVKKPQN
ncbi:unnamed protein product, partial [Mesorhabditis spiculigera]